MASPSYLPTHKHGEDREELDPRTWSTPKKNALSTRIVISVLILLATNLSTWYMSNPRPTPRKHTLKNEVTPYAGLQFDTYMSFGMHSVYNGADDEARDAAWRAINVDDGMIALPYDYIATTDLPISQVFPWDRNKGIYLINAYHSLHCIRAVYNSLAEFHAGVPQTMPWGHVVHCADAIRQEAICNADDTPLYSENELHPGESGFGQQRKCRSWEKLEAWAKQFNSCYRYVNESASPQELPRIHRFTYCPEGSPYQAEVEKAFGKKTH